MPKTWARTAEASHRAAELAEFVAGFRRSKKGNLWRHFDGLTLTVFARRGDGFFGWCVCGNDGPRFSQGCFEDEHDAVSSLAWEMMIGQVDEDGGA
jgi:hypothetical protein